MSQIVKEGVAMRKKLISILAIASFALTACSQSQQGKSGEERKQIGILQYVELEPLDAAREGFLAELEDEGYRDGETVDIHYQNAQGDQSSLPTMSEKLLADNDLVLGIATQPAQSLTTVSSKTPVLFTAVSDPVSAKIIKSFEQPGGRATGTTNMAPVSERVALLQKVMPNLKKVGIMYTTNELNSELQVKKAKKAFKEAGIETVVKGISSTNDIQDTTRSLMEQTEVLFMPTDGLIDSSISIVTDLSKEMKVPVVSGSADLVESGVLFAYGPNYEKLGRQTAKQAIAVLEGKDIADIPAEEPAGMEVTVNKEMEKYLGIDLSPIEDN